MKGSRCLLRISKVPTKEAAPASSLVYHPRYSISRKMSLSPRFDVVSDKNRFLSLDLVLRRLSGHIGRRQYKIQADLPSHLDKLKELGVDWQDLKSLHRDELLVLFNDVLRLNHTEKALLLTALEAKLCGVLRRSDTRHSTAVCTNRGVLEHGWRCGQHGHTNDVYFEGKQKASPALLQTSYRSSLRQAKRDGVQVSVRSQPDFSVVGRYSQELNPRVWSSPENANFSVSTIGYEFRVHPDDPRSKQQIEDAAAEWELHSAVVQQVIWEMLELHGVARDPQPQKMEPGELGDPDDPHEYSSAFTTRGDDISLARATASNPPQSSSDGIPQQDCVTEHRMLSADGKERSWFQAPLYQHFENGVPAVLPFAPTLIIRSTFRSVRRSATADEVTSHLIQPVVDVSCLVHPNACFWWNAEDEERCVRQILEYAKRMPFALPFNLYYRVDLSKELRLYPEIEDTQRQLLQEKADWFNLRQYRTFWKRDELSSSEHGDD